MGHFSDFFGIFQYNFGDSWDIHGMRSIILGYFYNNYDGNMYISFQDLHDPSGVIFQNFLLFFRGTYERGLVIIDITMACDLSF